MEPFWVQVFTASVHLPYLAFPAGSQCAWLLSCWPQKWTKTAERPKLMNGSFEVKHLFIGHFFITCCLSSKSLWTSAYAVCRALRAWTRDLSKFCNEWLNSSSRSDTANSWSICSWSASGGKKKWEWLTNVWPPPLKKLLHYLKLPQNLSIVLRIKDSLWTFESRLR